MKRNLFAGGARSRGLSVNVFTESELEDIHLASLEVLERTGVFVEAQDARDIFKDGGCTIDADTRMVRIPPHVVEEAIASSPSKYVLCGRDPKNDFLMEPGRVAFTNFSEGIAVVDVGTGQVRECTLQDVGDIARLNDHLSEMDTHEISVGARDVPPETAAVHNTEAQLLNTTKPLGIGPLSGMECNAILRMCAEVVGGADELAGTADRVRRGLPRQPAQAAAGRHRGDPRVRALGHPQQHPEHGDGWRLQPRHARRHLVTHNAEVLAGITLSQLTERGCPMMYGSSTTAMDLRLAAASVGSPEIALISAGVAQLARRYMIPSFVAGL